MHVKLIAKLFATLENSFVCKNQTLNFRAKNLYIFFQKTKFLANNFKKSNFLLTISQKTSLYSYNFRHLNFRAKNPFELQRSLNFSYLSKHFSIKLVTVVEQLVHPWQLSLELDFSIFIISLAKLATEGLLCPLAK